MPNKTLRKNENGMGCISLRKDGRWMGRYTIGIDPISNKQIQRSIYGKSQKEVTDRLRDILSENNFGSGPILQDLSLDEWLKLWMKEYSGNKRSSTLRNYKQQIDHHISPALGKTALDKLTPMAVQKFYNSLGKTLQAKTIHNVHGVLNEAMSQAVKNGYIRENPVAGAVLPKVYKTEQTPLSNEQVVLFMTEAKKDEVFGRALLVILFCGLRESEMIGLTWSKIDFEHKTMRIDKQLQRDSSAKGFVFVAPKNGKPRTLTPCDYVLDMLREQKEYQDKQRSAFPEAWAKPVSDPHFRDLVFTMPDGRNMSPQTLYRHFKAIAERIGAQDCCVHDLRHSYATLSLQNGDDIRTLQGNLGHATAAFTLEVYCHVTDHMREESANRMQSYILGLSRRPEEEEFEW